MYVPPYAFPPTCPSPDPASAYGGVAIGASAGGIRALREILSLLPADFPMPVFVVLHLSRTEPSKLAEVLGFRAPMRVKWAQSGERALPGTVYVAPMDRHLLLRPGGRLELCASAPVAWWRPAVDRLFESVAAALGPRGIGVVLSGALWDGMKGMAAIRDAGGLTIAQDEDSADHCEMPSAAIDMSGADIILPPPRIAQALAVAGELRVAPSCDSAIL